MLTDNEKKIFDRINFVERYLNLRSKFINNGSIVPTFNKKEILKTLEDLGYKSQYLSQGYYEYKKSYNEYTFQFLPKITRNIPLIYLNIFKDDEILDNRVTNLGSVLKYISYDPNMINPRFRINSLDELKEYLKRMLEIYEDFVAEYIKDIESEKNQKIN